LYNKGDDLASYLGMPTFSNYGFSVAGGEISGLTSSGLTTQSIQGRFDGSIAFLTKQTGGTTIVPAQRAGGDGSSVILPDMGGSVNLNLLESRKSVDSGNNVTDAFNIAEGQRPVILVTDPESGRVLIDVATTDAMAFAPGARWSAAEASFASNEAIGLGQYKSNQIAYQIGLDNAGNTTLRTLGLKESAAPIIFGRNGRVENAAMLLETYYRNATAKDESVASNVGGLSGSHNIFVNRQVIAFDNQQQNGASGEWEWQTASDFEFKTDSYRNFFGIKEDNIIRPLSFQRADGNQVLYGFQGLGIIPHGLQSINMGDENNDPLADQQLALPFDYTYTKESNDGGLIRIKEDTLVSLTPTEDGGVNIGIIDQAANLTWANVASRNANLEISDKNALPWSLAGNESGDITLSYLGADQGDSFTFRADGRVENGGILAKTFLQDAVSTQEASKDGSLLESRASEIVTYQINNGEGKWEFPQGRTNFESGLFNIQQRIDGGAWIDKGVAAQDTRAWMSAPVPEGSVNLGGIYYDGIQYYAGGLIFDDYSSAVIYRDFGITTGGKLHYLVEGSSFIGQYEKGTIGPRATSEEAQVGPQAVLGYDNDIGKVANERGVLTTSSESLMPTFISQEGISFLDSAVGVSYNYDKSGQLQFGNLTLTLDNTNLSVNSGQMRLNVEDGTTLPGRQTVGRLVIEGQWVVNNDSATGAQSIAISGNAVYSDREYGILDLRNFTADKDTPYATDARSGRVYDMRTGLLASDDDIGAVAQREGWQGYRDMMEQNANLARQLQEAGFLDADYNLEGDARNDFRELRNAASLSENSAQRQSYALERSLTGTTEDSMQGRDAVTTSPEANPERLAALESERRSLIARISEGNRLWSEELERNSGFKGIFYNRDERVRDDNRALARELARVEAEIASLTPLDSLREENASLNRPGFDVSERDGFVSSHRVRQQAVSNELESRDPVGETLRTIAQLSVAHARDREYADQFKSDVIGGNLQYAGGVEYPHMFEGSLDAAKEIGSMERALNLQAEQIRDGVAFLSINRSLLTPEGQEALDAINTYMDQVRPETVRLDQLAVGLSPLKPLGDAGAQVVVGATKFTVQSVRVLAGTVGIIVTSPHVLYDYARNGQLRAWEYIMDYGVEYGHESGWGYRVNSDTYFDVGAGLRAATGAALILAPFVSSGAGATTSTVGSTTMRFAPLQTVGRLVTLGKISSPLANAVIGSAVLSSVGIPYAAMEMYDPNYRTMGTDSAISGIFLMPSRGIISALGNDRAMQVSSVEMGLARESLQENLGNWGLPIYAGLAAARTYTQAVTGSYFIQAAMHPYQNTVGAVIQMIEMGKSGQISQMVRGWDSWNVAEAVGSFAGGWAGFKGVGRIHGFSSELASVANNMTRITALGRYTYHAVQGISNITSRAPVYFGSMMLATGIVGTIKGQGLGYFNQT
ncbi:MAG: hypothetical protein PHP89_06540, partial [Candidatus Omnitrophica bacterium]|nr:hypothetical protein [Candidatus Omnitrophota bacterium]